MRTSNSSRGQLGFETAWVFIALIVLVMGVVFVYPAFKELNTDIQQSSMSAESKEASELTAGGFAQTWDNVLFFFLMLMWGFLIISSFFASTHPAFAFITIILSVFGIVAVMILAQAYLDGVEDQSLDSASDSFPKMHWVMEHITIIMVLFSLTVMLTLYARASL